MDGLLGGPTAKVSGDVRPLNGKAEARPCKPRKLVSKLGKAVYITVSGAQKLIMPPAPEGRKGGRPCHGGVASCSPRRGAGWIG